MTFEGQDSTVDPGVQAFMSLPGMDIFAPKQAEIFFETPRVFAPLLHPGRYKAACMLAEIDG